MDAVVMIGAHEIFRGRENIMPKEVCDLKNSFKSRQYL